jgi:hypothetical protein
MEDIIISFYTFVKDKTQAGALHQRRVTSHFFFAFFCASSRQMLDSGRSTGLVLPQKGSKLTKISE